MSLTDAVARVQELRMRLGWPASALGGSSEFPALFADAARMAGVQPDVTEVAQPAVAAGEEPAGTGQQEGELAGQAASSGIPTSADALVRARAAAELPAGGLSSAGLSAGGLSSAGLSAGGLSSLATGEEDTRALIVALLAQEQRRALGGGS